MPDTLPFVTLPHIPSLFSTLNAIINRKSVGIVEGSYAVGKSRLLEHFKNVEATVRSDQIISTQLVAPYRRTFDDDLQRIGSPITLFWAEQVVTHLQKNGALLDTPPLEKHTRRGLSTMYRLIERGVQNYPIRAIVIDDAHHLDSITLDWLWRVRELARPRCAIILCAKLKPKEKQSSALNHALHVQPALRDSLTERIAMKPFTRNQSIEYIFRPLMKELNLSLDATEYADKEHITNLYNTIWSLTNANWYLIDRLIRLMLDYAEEEQATRWITTNVMSAIEQKLKSVTLSDDVKEKE